MPVSMRVPVLGLEKQVGERGYCEQRGGCLAASCNRPNKLSKAVFLPAPRPQ